MWAAFSRQLSVLHMGDSGVVVRNGYNVVGKSVLLQVLSTWLCTELYLSTGRCYLCADLLLVPLVET